MSDDVERNLRIVYDLLPNQVKLVAISKFHSIESIKTAYLAGQRLFGESREQELSEKVRELPSDIEWHFIGHLQTNKVKSIAPYISMIETVDSMKLLREINKQAVLNNRIIDVLLEIHIAEESTKYGLTIEQCRDLLADNEWRKLCNVRICGIMAMASNVHDENQIRSEFTIASNFFDELKKSYFCEDQAFCERSWGMSHDYKIAVDCNSTMVRIGTAIFGEREY